MVRTTTTGTTVVRTTTHDLSMNGRAGAMLIMLLITLALFIIAFATAGWSNSGRRHGLWENCSTGSNAPVAVQVLMCLALVALVIAVILVFLYLFVTSVSKYQVLLGLVITIFITFALMLIGLIVYGVERHELYWSYAVACISTILCLAAGIVAAIQIARC